MNALEQLERDRVGLAPAASRLLREREQFGEGAVLGPLSDFIARRSGRRRCSSRSSSATTVHAVLVRDRAVADAIRAWHATANPGPLLLLPLDAADATTRAATATPDALSHSSSTRAAPARAWVRTLLGHVHALDDGSAFVDARGAVWLPGTTAGPGPLRRRAELRAAAHRADVRWRRRDRKRRARPTRCASRCVASERRVVEATEAAAVAQQAARGAVERQAESARRVARADARGAGRRGARRAPRPRARPSWPSGSARSTPTRPRSPSSSRRASRRSPTRASAPPSPSAVRKRRASCAGAGRSSRRRRRRASRWPPIASGVSARKSPPRRSGSRSSAPS